MEADVEALLVNRLGARRGSRRTSISCVPIDQCFKLVGLVRTHWRGLSGGEELWQALEVLRRFDRAAACGSVTMPDLDFRVESAAAVPFAAAPLLAFRIAVTNADRRRADSQRRPALPDPNRSDAPPLQRTEEQERLLDLFGEPERWGQTLRNMLWTNASATVPPFTGSTTVDLQVPCTFDFNVAATKYFHGLETGEIPLCFLFSGTVFYDGGDGAPQVAPISWSKEARFRLPVETWRDMMETYYPNSAWLCLRRDVFERLYRIQGPQRNSDLGSSARTNSRGVRGGGEIMNDRSVEKIADAVLYEGYLLYPYRSSAVKNRQRFNFGVVYPREYSEAGGGVEPCEMETAVPGAGRPADRALASKVRCLRLVERDRSSRGFRRDRSRRAGSRQSAR